MGGEGWVQLGIPEVASIFIKGITYFADGKKNDKWQLHSSKSSSQLCLHFRLKDAGLIVNCSHDKDTHTQLSLTPTKSLCFKTSFNCCIMHSTIPFLCTCNTVVVLVLIFIIIIIALMLAKLKKRTEIITAG